MWLQNGEPLFTRNCDFRCLPIMGFHLLRGETCHAAELNAARASCSARPFSLSVWNVLMTKKAHGLPQSVVFRGKFQSRVVFIEHRRREYDE